MRISKQDVERVIIILGVSYIIVFAIAFISYPKVIFGGGNIAKVSNELGFERIYLNGIGFLFLFSFYSLNKYINKRRFFWLIIYIITMIFTIMTLTRSLIAVSLIVSTMYILRKSKSFYKIIAVLFIGCFVYFVTQTNFYQLLLEKTLAETQNFKDYIRIRSALFYMIDFSPNIFARIFGNGIPSEGSSYFRYCYSLEMDLGYYQSDIGYIGLYSKFGLLAILAYIILIYRTVNVAVPDDYLYCKYFLYFVFLISIIIDAPFNPGYITTIALTTYVLHTKELSQA